MRDELRSLEEGASRRTRQAVLVALLAAAGFFGFLQIAGRSARTTPTAESAAASSETAMSGSVQPTLEIVAGQGSGYATTGRSGAGQSYVGVYECAVKGQRVLSDRPCGPDAQARTLVVDQPDPQDAMAARQRSAPAPTASPPRYTSPVAPTKQAPVAGDSAGSNENRCEQIDDEIDRINARMRHPFTTSEGNWLRARWHALYGERYELRCGR